jgi:hypothetical protein
MRPWLTAAMTEPRIILSAISPIKHQEQVRTKSPYRSLKQAIAQA